MKESITFEYMKDWGKPTLLGGSDPGIIMASLICGNVCPHEFKKINQNQNQTLKLVLIQSNNQFIETLESIECWFVGSMLTVTYVENADVQKRIHHRSPSLQSPVKVTRYFWSREGEVMTTVGTVQVGCRGEAVKMFYVGPQEKTEDKVSFRML